MANPNTTANTRISLNDRIDRLFRESEIFACHHDNIAAILEQFRFAESGPHQRLDFVELFGDQIETTAVFQQLTGLFDKQLRNRLLSVVGWVCQHHVKRIRRQALAMCGGDGLEIGQSRRTGIDFGQGDGSDIAVEKGDMAGWASAAGGGDADPTGAAAEIENSV